MERLTHKARWEAGYKKNRNVHDWECIDKLGQLEDLQEKGLFVKLPCKVGDTLYRFDSDPLISQKEVVSYDVDNIVLCENGEVLFKYDAYDGVICDLNSLITGEPYFDYYRVFLTREQAEQALKEVVKINA